MGLSHDRGGKSKQIVAQIAGSAIHAVHACAETAQSIIPGCKSPQPVPSQYTLKNERESMMVTGRMET